MLRACLLTAAVLFGSPLAGQGEGPLGHLVLLGGGARPSYVMERVAELAGGQSGRVLVVATANPRPEEAAASLIAELELAGVGQAMELAFDEGSVDAWETLERVKQASGVFLAGGDQALLVERLRGTQLLDQIRALYERGGVVVGSSAGATALGSLMITGGAPPDDDPDRGIRSIRAGAIAARAGLDFLPDTIVDQHFVHRRRHNRLLTALLENPELLAIGIDEETAIVIGPPTRFEVLGERLVAVYDLSWGGPVTSDPQGNLSAHGISLHLLRSGQAFDLAGRTVLP